MIENKRSPKGLYLAITDQRGTEGSRLVHKALSSKENQEFQGHSLAAQLFAWYMRPFDDSLHPPNYLPSSREDGRGTIKTHFRCRCLGGLLLQLLRYPRIVRSMRGEFREPRCSNSLYQGPIPKENTQILSCQSGAGHGASVHTLNPRRHIDHWEFVVWFGSWPKHCADFVAAIFCLKTLGSSYHKL